MPDVKIIRESLGRYRLSEQDLSALADSLSRPPRTAIRVRKNALREWIPFALDSVPWHDQAFFVPVGSRPGGCLAYAAGEYFIQDAASLLAVRLLAAQPGEIVCDLCAAPGGKATAILEGLGGTGWLVANEVIHSRLGVLDFTLARHGATRYLVSHLDAEQLAARSGPVFDAVLVDAPCSGQSLVSRGKQSWSSFSNRQIEHSVARQSRILDAASSLIRPGGRIVYSTCTFADAENEQQIEQFLQRYARFIIEPCEELKHWESQVLPGSYRLWPQLDSCGGAFAVRLRKQDSESSFITQARPHKNEDSLARFPQLADWGAIPIAEFRCHGPRVFGWSQHIPESLMGLTATGPEIAYRAGNTWFPSYALAMRRDPSWRPHTTNTLSEQEAIQYVSGAVVPASSRGWSVATWRELALGWLKTDGRQGKNHLPKQARIQISRQ